jgi:putative sigma-54 modulation protein
MQIEFTGRNMTVTQRLRERAEQGLGRIERVVGKAAKAHIILTRWKNRTKAELTVKSRKAEVVAAAESLVMEAALESVLEKAERQVLRMKERRVERKRNGRVTKEERSGLAEAV